MTVKWNISAKLPEAFKKRLYERMRNIRLGKFNYTLSRHLSEINYNSNFNVATILAHIHNKWLRQFFEASASLLLSSVNTRPGFFNLFPFLGKLFLNNYNISHFNYLSFLESHELNLNLFQILPFYISTLKLNPSATWQDGGNG